MTLKKVVIIVLIFCVLAACKASKYIVEVGDDASPGTDYSISGPSCRTVGRGQDCLGFTFSTDRRLRILLVSQNVRASDVIAR